MLGFKTGTLGRSEVLQAMEDYERGYKLNNIARANSIHPGTLEYYFWGIRGREYFEEHVRKYPNGRIKQEA